METVKRPGRTTPRLLDMEALERASECLRSVAHPVRLRLLQLLLHGDYTVGELAEACGIASHAASEHLGLMRDRGLLSCERRGRKAYYRVAIPAIGGIVHCVQRNFGDPEP